VLLLGSCLGVAQTAGSAQAPGSDSVPTLEQARADFYAVIDDTQELIGGEWDVQDDPNSRGCLLEDGSAGRTFSVLRLAPPSDLSVTASVTTASVTAAWEQAGYEVEQMSIGPVTQLIATSEAHEQLIFRVSDRAMTLQGESECRPVSTR